MNFFFLKTNTAVIITLIFTTMVFPTYISFSQSIEVNASSNLSAQCIADAGDDIHRCSTDSSVTLGGNPTASNGTAPYSYEWKIDPIATGSQSIPYIHASNLLSDTTIANPTFSCSGGFIDTAMTFYLKVSDASGCQSHDTIVVSTSIFTTNLASYYYWVEVGDSVFLNESPNIGSLYDITLYDWNPSHGLSDTNIDRGFWAKPDTTIRYALTITDSKGCSSTAEPMYHIYVSPLNATTRKKEIVSLYPNPASDILFVQKNEDTHICKYELFNATGQLLSTFNGDFQCFNIKPLKNGLYFLKVFSNKKVYTFQFLKTNAK